MKNLRILQTVEVQNFTDFRGIINVLELASETYFKVQRIYYLSDIPSDVSRGKHAHKELNQIFLCLSGSFELTVTNGRETETVVLHEHSNGYFLPLGHWRELNNFTPNAICLVLASKHYDESDYIHSYKEFLEWRKINWKL